MSVAGWGFGIANLASRDGIDTLRPEEFVAGARALRRSSAEAGGGRHRRDRLPGGVRRNGETGRGATVAWAAARAVRRGARVRPAESERPQRQFHVRADARRLPRARGVSLASNPTRTREVGSTLQPPRTWRDTVPLCDTLCDQPSMKRLTLGVAVLLSIAVARSAAAQPYSSRRNGDVVQLEDTRSRTVVSIALSVGNIAFEMKINGANVLWWPYASVEEFKAKPAQSGFPSSGWANRLDEQAFTRTAPYAFDTAPERPGAIPIHGFLTTNPTGSSWSGADASSAWVTSRLEFTNNPRG